MKSLFILLGFLVIVPALLFFAQLVVPLMMVSIPFFIYFLFIQKNEESTKE